jgi:hypothetical protein
VPIFPSLALITVAAAAPHLSPDLDAIPERVVYATRTELEFDSVELDARVVRPDVVLLPEPRRPGFTPLIRLRADFRDTIDAGTAGVR